jgi:beta-glucosidase
VYFPSRSSLADFVAVCRGLRRTFQAWIALLLLGFAFPCTAPAQTSQNQTSEIERKIDASLASMSLEEKISLLSGGSVLGSTPLPRLGIPAFRMGDGPIGAHDPSPSTAFAAGIALAATWDRDLSKRIGTQIGRDSRSRGAAFLLGPGVNIYRVPLNGRNHEYFGEDPFLAAQITVPYIEGVQSQGVSATVKHFVGNESEFARFSTDTVVSERALREIYLPAFEAAVREAHVGAIMDSYNDLNGVQTTENAHLNIEIAKHQWGFGGVIMSDWVATHNGVAAANGGLDLEMPAGICMNTDTLIPAIKSGKVAEATIDDKIRRMLRLAARFGWISPDSTGQGWISHDPLDLSIPRYNQQGREVALEGALESATLLKNNANLLPLDRAKFKNIALIGPNAFPGYATGGGSGMVAPFFVTGPFRGISDYLGSGSNVTYNQGIARLDVLAQQTAFTLAANGTDPGVTVETYNNPGFTGTPVSSRHEASINAGPYAQLPADTSDSPNSDILALDATMKEAMRKSVAGTLSAPTQYARWTAFYHAPSEGKYLVFVEHPGKYRLTIDGTVVIDHADIARAAVSQSLIDLKPGAHKVVFDDLGVPPFGNGTLRLGIAKEDSLVHPAAIELARHADAVVLSVGFDIETEAEGEDREFQLLPGQNELIQQIAAVNPNTIVVLNAGGSVDASSWIDSVPALLHIWYSGEEGGAALARILFGDANPSGRLPISWERKIADNPSADYYYPAPGTNRVLYGNDVFVGYRGFEHNHTEPLFPFGFGLSYTTFQYSNLQIHPSSGTDANGTNYEVAFDVTNTGPHAGADVAQVYLAEDHPTIARPPHELKGFARVQLDPGQTRHITIPLDARSFAWYDVGAKAWHADAGTFTIHVSRSSADPQLEGKITLAQPLIVPVE